MFRATDSAALWPAAITSAVKVATYVLGLRPSNWNT